MRWHSLNLKLSHQAIFITSVPVLFEVLLVITILCLGQAGEHQLREEIRARNILGYCSALTSVIIRSAGSMSFMVLGGSEPEFDQHELQSRNRAIDENLSSLDKILKGEEERQRLARIVKSTNNLKTLFKSAYSRDELGMVSVGKAKRVKPLIFDLENAIQDLSQTEQASLDQAHAKYLLVQRLIQVTCWASLAVSLLVGLAMLSYFNRSVTSRMKTLKSNAERVTTNESLLPQLDGYDEFAEVDTSFHKMAADLTRATLRRKELMQMVTHDLRSPLSSILLSIQFLITGNRGEISTDARQELLSAKDGAERLIKLTNDLLKMEATEAEMVAIEKRRTSLAFLILKSVEAVQPLAFEKSIEIDYPEQGPTVYVDPDRIIQVLVNLLSNAIKFSPVGQPIEVSVASRSAEQERKSAGWVEVSVIDHGRGIPATEIGKLFQRFTQVEREDKKQGAGLGLAISKGLIEAHGGKIGCESELNSGSRFWFEIPMS